MERVKICGHGRGSNGGVGRVGSGETEEGLADLLDQRGGRGTDRAAGLRGGRWLGRVGEDGSDEPVVSEVLAGFGGAGEAEEAAIEPGFGIHEGAGFADQAVGVAAGVFEARGIDAGKVSEVGLGGLTEAAVDDPAAVGAVDPGDIIRRRGV